MQTLYNMRYIPNERLGVPIIHCGARKHEQKGQGYMAKTKAAQTRGVDAIVSEVLNYVRDAVGDIASQMLSPSGCRDEKWDKRIKRATRNGVQDLLGWLADELYNDADTLSDVMGDHIHELVHGDEAEFQKVLDAISERGHPALKRACEDLRR
jgi:hypothetical protein